MSKSLALGLFITFLVIGGIGFYFYRTQVNVQETPGIEAIPDDAAFVFEVNNFPQSAQALFNSPLWNELRKSSDFNVFSEKVLRLDSIVFNNEDFMKLLKNQKLFFSVHPGSQGRFSYLFTIEYNNAFDEEYLNKWLLGVAKPGSSFSKRIFNKIKINDLFDPQRKILLSYTFYDGLILFSENPGLVEDGLRKMLSGSLKQKKMFHEVRELITPSADANIYINYAALPAFFRNFTNGSDPGLFSYIKDFAATTALDLRISESGFQLNGVSSTGDSTLSYLDLFKTQQPQPAGINSIIPSTTAFMLHFGISDPVQFNKSIHEYLLNSGRAFAYKNYTDSIRNIYDIGLEELLQPLASNEAALLMLEPAGAAFEKDLVAVVKSSNAQTLAQNIGTIKAALARKGETDSLNLQYSGYNISKLRLGNFLRLLYAGPFEGIHSPFTCIINEYLVLANSYEAMCVFLDQYKSGKTLAADEQYRAYAENISSTSNVFLYWNLSRCAQLPAYLGSEWLISNMSRNQVHYKKFEYLSLQYSSTSNKLFYTTLNFKFSQSPTVNSREETAGKLWNLQLDTSIAIKPQVVYHPESGEYGVLVQDVMNTLYYISNAGKMVWDKRLGSRIISDIHEVDMLNNGQRQYLFNTDEQVFLLDGQGNNLPGYPMKLEAKASAGLTLCHYDSNDYRFYVPCENQNAYGYNLKGKKLEGWNPRTLEYNVKYALRSFNLGSRQFLYSSTERGTMYVWMKKGLRAPFNHKKKTLFTSPYSVEVVDSSYARFYALDTAGLVYSYVFGGTADSIIPVQLGKAAFFEAIDLDGDADVEFVSGTAGKFRIFTKEGRETGSFDVGDTSVQSAFFVKLNGRTLIGVASGKNNKVYLFNANGSVYSSFPLTGSTAFQVSEEFRSGNKCMIVGDVHGYLNLYMLK